MSSRNFLTPFRLVSSLADDEGLFPKAGGEFSQDRGLSIYEDEKNVSVEAALPGLKGSDIEVTYNKGVLWVQGESQEEEEDKDKKYYHKSSRSYSYHLTVPGHLDDTKEPEATYKDGIMTVTFPKAKEEVPKKIKVKHH